MAAPTTPPPGLGVIRYRKEITSLPPPELEALREAFQKAFAITDDRGYQHWAGIHGLPLPMYCQHGNLLFLPWHRAYLYLFEKALQDQIPGIMLPYWDWTAQASIDSGLPPAYASATYSPNGAAKPNPLYSAAVGFEGNRPTTRRPKPPSGLKSLATLVATAQTEASFDLYSPAIESPHNGLHMWVRGDMGQIPYAAYDPIFWAHHANIDRLWAKWQLDHPNMPTPNVQTALPPFGMTVQQTVDTRALGYAYAAAAAFQPV